MPANKRSINIQAMQAETSKASSLLSAMCNENRLKILCQLIGNERTVNEFAELLGAAQPTISQHPALLRHEGLVKSRRHGRTRYYSLAGPEAHEILLTLQSLYCKT
jgi:DNA-binding transcriptional ArsR family regulator